MFILWMGGKKLNREALPLLVGIILPIVLVGIIILYFHGIDLTIYLRRINILYYIIVFPIFLGVTIAFFKWRQDK